MRMSDNKSRATLNLKKSSTIIDGTEMDATFKDATDDNVLSDVEYDIAKSVYLRTLITNQLVEEKIAKNVGDMYDQLAQQVEVLLDLENKQFKLEKKVKCLELNVEVKKVFKNLNDIFFEVTKLLDDYGVDDNLNQCIKIGEENAYSKVYLKNVKPLENSDEYDKFLSVVTNCMDSLEKLQNVITNDTEVQILRDNVKNFKELQAQLTSKHQLLIERQNESTYSAFKTLSDKFATIHQ